MAGIYFHIPFCKQACYYCDFHFSTDRSYKAELVATLQKETNLRKDYLSDPIETIYFGGGTPSLLDEAELNALLDSVYKNFSVSDQPEITLEANPDDLNERTILNLKRAGINRLSIGIQTFDDDVLKSLNRAHDSTTAERSVKASQDAGITNISIDLIYAIPGMTQSRWKENISKGISLSPKHISAYSLTIEEKTAFGRWAAKGKIVPVSDDTAANHLSDLVDVLEHHQFEQYEVSNFALPGFRSRHNSSYWRQLPYLGIGPSAHSYNIESRQYNIANNHLYIKSIKEGKIPATLEVLTREEKVNDYLLTTLRTTWGANLSKLRSTYAYDLLNMRKDYLDKLIQTKLAYIDNEHVILTRAGLFLADKISADLFL